MRTVSELDDYFLNRFKEGHEPSFERVFKSDYNRIVGFCKQFIGDKDKSQSLAQEAFVKLWLNREKVESLNGIHSFLFTAAKAECLNYLRHQKVISNYKNKKLQLFETELNLEVLESFDFDTIEFTELELLINQSISHLPEKCRLVFTMSRIDGKKNCEIADELDISVKSVEANITRALKTLRISLADYLPTIFLAFFIP
jgi:RNA polymerase sigma-70 factor (ECF subfamily)